MRIVSAGALVGAPRGTLALSTFAVAAAASGRAVILRLSAAAASVFAVRARPALTAAGSAARFTAPLADALSGVAFLAAEPLAAELRAVRPAVPPRPARALRPAAFDGARGAVVFSAGPAAIDLTPDFAAAAREAVDLAIAALVAAVFATEVLEAAVRAVLAAAALTVFFAALALSAVFVFGVLALLVVLFEAVLPEAVLLVLPGVVRLVVVLTEAAPLVAALAPDALTARDVLDLDSPSLAPPLALDDALRFLAVFLLEGIRGYSLSLSRCGDGTGSHMAEEAKSRPDQDSANDRAYFRLAKARRFTLWNRAPDRVSSSFACRGGSPADGESRVFPLGKTRPLRPTRPNAIR